MSIKTQGVAPGFQLLGLWPGMELSSEAQKSKSETPGWIGAWQRKGKRLADVYLPTIATAAAESAKSAAPPEWLDIDFRPVESVKLAARCLNVDDFLATSRQAPLGQGVSRLVRAD